MHLVLTMAGAGSRTRTLFEGPKPFLPIGRGQTLLELAMAGLPWKNIEFVTFAINDEIESWASSKGRPIQTYLTRDVESAVINVGNVTNGQATTVEIALASVQRNGPLLIANCDTYFETTMPPDYLAYDGLLGVFRSESPNYSYARLNEAGDVIETAEKIVISNLASSGLYYFGTTEIYREALRKTAERGERYIAPLYNDMIAQGLRVGVFEHDFVTPLGTAQEIQDYLVNRPQPL
jgi:NDP-sugar pyrophosphorylase family protein